MKLVFRRTHQQKLSIGCASCRLFLMNQHKNTPILNLANQSADITLLIKESDYRLTVRSHHWNISIATIFIQQNERIVFSCSSSYDLKYSLARIFFASICNLQVPLRKKNRRAKTTEVMENPFLSHVQSHVTNSRCLGGKSRKCFSRRQAGEKENAKLRGRENVFLSHQHTRAIMSLARSHSPGTLFKLIFFLQRKMIFTETCTNEESKMKKWYYGEFGKTLRIEGLAVSELFLFRHIADDFFPWVHSRRHSVV